jgi:hypothetical protein
MAAKTQLEIFKDLEDFKPSQIEDAIDSFTNSDTDRYNRLVNSFVEYVKEGIFTAYSGYSYNSTGNEIHFFKGDHDKGNAVLEFSERFGLIKNDSIKWKEIKITNNNPIDERLLYFEVLTAKFQRACNVLFLNKILVANLNKSVEAKSEEVKTPELSVKQQALILVHGGSKGAITRETHGNHLYSTYCEWNDKAFRIRRNDMTPRRLKERIKLFESIIEFLAPENKQKVIDEVKILKTHLFDK